MKHLFASKWIEESGESTRRRYLHWSGIWETRLLSDVGLSGVYRDFADRHSAERAYPGYYPSFKARVRADPHRFRRKGPL